MQVIIDLEFDDLITAYNQMSPVDKERFLKAVVVEPIKPKKLTAKQELAEQAALLKVRLQRKYKVAADKLLPELRKSIK